MPVDPNIASLLELERLGKLDPKKVAVLNQLREMGYEEQFPRPLPPVYPGGPGSTGSLLEKIGGSVQAFERPAMAGLTLGGSKQLEDLGRYIGAKILGKDSSLEDIRSERREFEEGLSEQFPVPSAAGKVAGFASSMIPYGVGTSALSKIPLLAKGLESRGVVNTLIKALPSAAARGGAVAGTATAIDPDVEGYLPTGAGAALDVGVTSLGRMGGGLLRFFKNVIRLTPGLENTQKGLKEMAEERLAGRYGSNLKKFSQKAGTEELDVAGEEVQKGFTDITQKASQEYLAFKDKMLSLGGKEKISAKPFMESMDAEINKITDRVAAANPDKASLKKFLEEKLRPEFAALKGKPTLADLDRLSSDLYELADIGGRNRGPKEFTFERLYRAARKTMIDGFDEVIEAKGLKDAPDIMKEREKIAKHLSLKEGPIGKLASVAPEEAITKAGTTGKLNLASVVDEALETNPAFKDPLKKAVLTDIVQKSKDPKALISQLEKYKNVLPKLLDASELKALKELSQTGLSNVPWQAPARAGGQAVIREISSYMGGENGA